MWCFQERLDLKINECFVQDIVGCAVWWNSLPNKPKYFPSASSNFYIHWIKISETIIMNCGSMEYTIQYGIPGLITNQLILKTTLGYLTCMFLSRQILAKQIERWCFSTMVKSQKIWVSFNVFANVPLTLTFHK